MIMMDSFLSCFILLEGGDFDWKRAGSVVEVTALSLLFLNAICTMIVIGTFAGADKCKLCKVVSEVYIHITREECREHFGQT
jgi:hypothetical protein